MSEITADELKKRGYEQRVPNGRFIKTLRPGWGDRDWMVSLYVKFNDDDFEGRTVVWVSSGVAIPALAVTTLEKLDILYELLVV